jgi:hypothetical protein
MFASPKNPPWHRVRMPALIAAHTASIRLIRSLIGYDIGGYNPPS